MYFYFMKKDIASTCHLAEGDIDWVWLNLEIAMKTTTQLKSFM